MKFLGSLPKDDIWIIREQFCDCVTSIIEAYEEQQKKVEYLKRINIKLARRERDQRIKINQLEHHVTELEKQLTQSVCENCVDKVTEQFKSLSTNNSNESEVITSTNLQIR